MIESTSDFLNGIQGTVLKLCEDDKNLGRSAVFDSSTLQNVDFENILQIKSQNDNFILALGILQWFFPEEARCLVYLALCSIRDQWLSEVPIDHIDPKTGEKVERNLDTFHNVMALMIILDSREHCLQYLKDVNLDKGILSSTNAFFGYVNSERFQIEFRKKVVPVFKSKKSPKKPVWRRGYKDKGTLPENYPNPRPKPVLPLTHLEIEKERQSYQDTLDFIRGWMDWGIELDEGLLDENLIEKKGEL
jgi:hypothetical protein